MANTKPTQAIDWGTKVPGGKTISVYFVPDGGRVADSWGDTYESDGMNAYEIGQFFRAFDLIERSVDLHFERVTSRSAADFVVGVDIDNEMGRNTLGWMEPAGEPRAGNAMFNAKQWDRTAGGDLTEGGYSFVTIVHELLHGLGLAHPFDRGGTSTIFKGVTRNDGFDVGPDWLNQGVFTTMSYASGFQRGPVGTSAEHRGYTTHGYEIGPSPLDIAVLQAKYGANTSHASGDTRYVLPDANVRGTGYEAIWDTGGTDVIVYNGKRDVTINLQEPTLQYEKGGGGFVSGAKGVAGGFTIAVGVTIENARSDRGDDRLVGNDAGNWISGRGGKDKLLGKAGDDTLLGGSGDDKLLGGDGADMLKGQNAADVLKAGDGDDQLQGGAGRDLLVGGVGDDTLLGGKGADVLHGDAGADTLVGGTGNDTLFGGADADLFQFTAGTGRDQIKDFEIAEDQLEFDASLWGGGVRTSAEIVAGAQVTTDGVLFDFGTDEVLLVGLTTTDGLEAAILI